MSTRTVYIKTALTGGATNAVDGVDGDDLLDGDVCHAFVSDVLYTYMLDDDSGAVESSPDIISPDANAGDKRWILQNVYGLSGKAASGANADITSLTGLDDDGIPLAKVADAMKDDGSNLAIGSDADGDMYYRASSVLARLAKGTANFKMFMNAGATAPEWASGFKIVKTTHDISVAGTQDITGFGFKPGLCFIIAVVNSTSTMSFGFDDGTAADCFADLYLQASNQWTYGNGESISLTTGNGVRAKAHITTLGSDGVTLTWAKEGSPTGTAQIFIAALR